MVSGARKSSYGTVGRDSLVSNYKIFTDSTGEWTEVATPCKESLMELLIQSTQESFGQYLPTSAG